MLSRFSDTQIWILNFLLVCGVFFLGLWVGGWDDTTEVAPAKAVEVPVMEGDFDDVHLIMEATSGNTFHLLCDMHFDPTAEFDTAECEYTDER